MKVSHDGDRVAESSATGEARPFRAPTSNAHLLGLMEDLESGDPERVVRAQLAWQPGRYGCSLPAIDRMVDIARRRRRVGAQLAGAGLGGFMMVLLRRDAVPRCARTLTDWLGAERSGARRARLSPDRRGRASLGAGRRTPAGLDHRSGIEEQTKKALKKHQL